MISAYLDRIEDEIAVLYLGDEMKKVNFPLKFLPEGVSDGDYLKIDIRLDEEEGEEALAHAISARREGAEA